uniref:Uncharacterized protein n=1 Tax=Musa acuminata subsp. malaccensis TaxID=214687 RepID=A0A804J4M3_MUSAM
MHCQSNNRLDSKSVFPSSHLRSFIFILL